MSGQKKVVSQDVLILGPIVTTRFTKISLKYLRPAKISYKITPPLLPYRSKNILLHAFFHRTRKLINE